jgi:sterol desaturase/sphingolipid hydroxylase (fatty acid hydroxylase superfamily)
VFEWLASAWGTLSTSFASLAWPALAFAALALAARGLSALQAARAAANEVRTNLLLFASDLVFVAPLLALLIAATGGFIQVQGLALSASLWTPAPAWLVGFAAIFAGDFVAYWRHRLEHVALLWPGHAIHHSDQAMTWTTGLRFHPLNRLTTALIDTTALALLGLPPWALALNNLVRHYYGLFIHMDLPWTYGPLGRLLVSPAMHRWHHVREGEGVGANFASIFAVFDQAFGTFHLPGPCAVPLGVPDPIGQGALANLIWPLRALSRALRGNPTPNPPRHVAVRQSGSGRDDISYP